MKMNISKLLLSTTLIMMSCSNIYATDQYEELGLNDFNYQYLSDKYKVEESTGALCGKSNTNLYPTYEGQKLYDMKTYLETDGNIDGDSNSQAPVGGGNPLNLVVFTFNYVSTNVYNYNGKTTYILTKTDSMLGSRIRITTDTNLIIPHGTTLDCKDISLWFTNNSMNSNILILGNITNTNHSCIYALLGILFKNTNVILGPNAVFDYNKIGTNPVIYYDNNTTKCILYPGCEIKTNNIDENLSKIKSKNYSDTIDQSAGNLYLNRYIEEGDEANRNKLVGTIRVNSHIIYPTTMQNSVYDKEKYKLKITGTENPYKFFMATSYFPSLYWHDTEHTYNQNLGSTKQYHFEEPVPIVFDDATKVLQLNLDNELAKYDVAFWNQCSIESGLYSFKEFVNKSGNKDKYINVDTLETLFIDGKNYKPEGSDKVGLLNNMPSEIFVGLTGTKDISIINNSEVTKLILHGNNTQYTGTVNLTPYITEVEFKDSNSFVKLKTHKYNRTIINENNELSNEEYDNLTITDESGTYDKSLKVSYYDVIDNRDVIKNINKYNVEGIIWNTDTLERCFKDGPGLLSNFPLNIIIANLVGNNDLVIKTNKTELYLLGDNSKYNRIITIPNNITDVYLNKQSIVKIIYKAKPYEITIDADDKISYRVNDRKTEPKDLGLNFHFIDVDFENIINYCKFENISNYVGLINYLDYYKKQNAKLTDTIDSAKTDVTNAIGGLETTIGSLATKTDVTSVIGDFGEGNIKGTLDSIKSEIDNLPAKTDISGLAKTTDLNNLATKTDVTNAIDSLKIGEVKTGIGDINKTLGEINNVNNGIVEEVKAEVGNVKDQVETKFKAIQKELSKINNTLNKPHKDMSTQTESSNKFKYNFDLKYSNEIEVDLNDEMSTTKAIVLEDNGFIKNTILWLKGDNRNFEGIVITPKHIEKVIFYPNSFCKVINPSGKKLKYKFVDENGNYIHH